MARTTLDIDLNRVEGDLEFQVDLDGNTVVDARCHHREDVRFPRGADVKEHQIILVVNERLLQGRLDVFGLFHADADVPIGLGELDEIRNRIHIGLRIAAAVEHLLPLADHSEIAIVQVDDLDRQSELFRRREFLNAHLDRTIAGNAGDLLVRMGKRRAHRIRQTDAHRPQTARIEPATRLVELVVLRCPHLVLANVRRNDRVATSHFPQLLDDVLRHDHIFHRVLHALAGTPFLNLLPPAADIDLGGLGLEQLDHVIEDVGNVADDRHVDTNPL